VPRTFARNGGNFTSQKAHENYFIKVKLLKVKHENLIFLSFFDWLCTGFSGFTRTLSLRLLLMWNRALIKLNSQVSRGFLCREKKQFLLRVIESVSVVFVCEARMSGFFVELTKLEKC
jgi:hypothetical protein